MSFRAVRTFCLVAGALVAACGPSAESTQTSTSTTSTTIATTSTSVTVSEENLTEFAMEVVGIVNEMQDDWDGRIAERTQQSANAEGSAESTEVDGYLIEAGHLAAMNNLLGSVSEDLPASAPEGSGLTEAYSRFQDAHHALTEWFGQLSESLTANTVHYASDPEAYETDINTPLNSATNGYVAACFELQSAMIEWYETLLLCGPQPPEVGPHGFMLFTGEDAKMRRPGFYENSDFFRTITFHSDGQWICNNECSHSHKEFGDALELKFTDLPGAWLIIVSGGDRSIEEHIALFEQNTKIIVGEQKAFAPTSDEGDWEGLTFTIEPSGSVGSSSYCGISSLPCAITDLGPEVSEWPVSYPQTIWILTRRNGRTILASAHFSPGYAPPDGHRETLLESAAPLVASLGFPD